MEDNKNRQENQQGAGKNPTLNEPGAQVADYGNPTGGSATENADQSREQNSDTQQGSGNRDEGNETMGNP